MTIQLFYAIISENDGKRTTVIKNHDRLYGFWDYII